MKPKLKILLHTVHVYRRNENRRAVSVVIYGCTQMPIWGMAVFVYWRSALRSAVQSPQ